MKVMLDTNILISAVLNPKGNAAKAFLKALNPPFEPIVCDYIVNELRRKFGEKFPHRVGELDVFLDQTLSMIKVVSTPEGVHESESKIRDIKDRPILRAALFNHIDCLLTGDKDFLESAVKEPHIVSVTEFLL